MIKLKFDLIKDLDYQKLSTKYQAKLNDIFDQLKDKKTPSSNMLGWIDYVNQDQTEIYQKIDAKIAEWDKLKVTDVVVIGIGGSYTGIKAILDITSYLPSQQKRKIHFVRSLSENTLINILEQVRDKNWAIVVISKSGTTLEPSVGFKLFREALYKQYDQQAAKRIVAITDPQKGVLHDLAVKNNYEMLPIYSDIGGRFSTLTPSGLLVAGLAGANYKDLILGAKQANADLFSSADLTKNTAYCYAALRHYLYTELKKDVEVAITYEEQHEYLMLQHRQLFGESEGKKENSLFPTYSVFTTDLHSMGQLYQQGKKIFFETVFSFEKANSNSLKLNKSQFDNDDKLDYVTNKSVNELNYIACEATKQAHASAGVPIIEIDIEQNNGYGFGYVYYWLCIATSVSALLLKHDPYDQPGVEDYKQRMFKLLGK
ncbi:glucose-6-phosphate isomerase [Mycoplasma bradburyae]|uniref:glucose-6-phosphate isomerase n=1 Tax=Mycoplasma bradburyae TaxID=2963128 RepID=UPI002340E136|nr:glucose-6-phosphate isomerase [Mycoplasma bradburyae]MDC4184366.1 glucose-6-phosphate isomerase [Mycoplasma bradburyae]